MSTFHCIGVIKHRTYSTQKRDGGDIVMLKLIFSYFFNSHEMTFFDDLYDLVREVFLFVKGGI